jgi:hypothetical protein
MFRKSEDVYGDELQGEEIQPLMWSSSGQYIAAAIDSTLNIWHIPGQIFKWFLVTGFIKM